jgi:uncharacterized membrane protein
MAMAALVLGLLIFLGVHSTRIFAENVRAKAITRLGAGPWKGIYSLFSLVGFALIVWGFGQARWNASQLWAPPIWAHHATVLLMLVSLILVGAYIFKKSHIAVAAHHPMVWGVAVWSAAHLIANGSTADLLLFGAFLVWAAADLVSAYDRDARGSAAYGPPNWGATISAIALGAALWLAFVGGLHLWLFGVSPLAGMIG